MTHISEEAKSKQYFLKVHKKTVEEYYLDLTFKLDSKTLCSHYGKTVLKRNSMLF